LIEVDLAIRKALHHKHPDIAKSLDLLTGLAFDIITMGLSINDVNKVSKDFVVTLNLFV
jgi:hypothetical protein